MTYRVVCFCGVTYFTQHPLRGCCPNCAKPLPGDEVPDTVPEEWQEAA